MGCREGIFVKKSTIDFSIFLLFFNAEFPIFPIFSIVSFLFSYFFEQPCHWTPCISPTLHFPPALACSFWAILCPHMVWANHLQIDCSLHLFLLVWFFRLHCQLVSFMFQTDCPLSTTFRWRSMFACRLCMIRQVRFLKLCHMTTYEPVSCHGKLNGCATEM